jgi:hypothetical protein
MTYQEKKNLLINSRAYRRLVRLFGVIFVLYALAMDGTMIRSFLASGDLFPGGRRFFVFSLCYWVAAAAILFAAAVAILRFVGPALMRDAKIQKVGQR